MITYDDDHVTFFFRNGESRSYGRSDCERSFEFDQMIEPPHARIWLRRADNAMFANYYEPCDR